MKNEMHVNRSRFIAIITILIIIIAGVLVYFFVIKPSMTGNIAKVQAEEDTRVLNAIVATINQTGYVQIPVMGTNQALTLVPYQLCAQVVAAQNAVAANATNTSI